MSRFLTGAPDWWLWVVAAVLGSLLGCDTAPEQIGPLEGELPRSFGVITAVRELEDGSVLVVDGRQREVLLVNLETAEVRNLGSRGRGAGQYLGPRLLLATFPDSALLVDVDLGRLLPMGLDGGFGPPVLTREVSPNLWADGAMPREADHLGHLYLTGAGIVEGPDGTAARDSTPLLRLDRRNPRLDTVTWIRSAKLDVQRFEGSDEVAFRFQPWRVQDEWALGPDGRIAVARGEPYRVEWILPSGEVIRGPVVPYPPVEVTAQDRSQAGGTLREWPEHKPAFGYRGAGEFGAVLVAPDGRVWVRRLMEAGESRTHYDVFDDQGRLLGQVVLPAGVMVRGFGRASLYTVRLDSAAGEYLGRLPMPKPH